MSELPKGWAHTAFECILDQIVGGGTPSKANTSYFQGTIPFMTVKDMTTRFPVDTVDHISEDAIKSSATTLVPKDTLIIATRMSLGKIVRPKFDTAINQDLKALFLRENIDKTYIEYFWRSKAQHIQDLGTGTTVKGIRLEDIRSLNVSLAPSVEQKRIADKLDTVLARVDACRERLNRVPLILKRFRQSVLAAATSGKLTEDWRKLNISVIDEPNVIEAILSPIVIHESDKRNTPSGWEWINLTKLAKLESGHTPRKTVPEYWENGDIPWISLQDIRNADGRELFDTKYKPTQIGVDNSSARILPKGTVCFCRDISFGYVTIMGRPMATTQHFANWVCNENLLPKFLMYVFMAGRNFLSMSGQGTTVTTIYMPALKELKILKPSIAEQTEIVRRVETLFAFADRLEARLANASAAADKLTPAFLAKAFRGELVPQDPNDEPASALLQRLAQANAGKERSPRAKRGAQASQVTAGSAPA